MRSRAKRLKQVSCLVYCIFSYEKDGDVINRTVIVKCLSYNEGNNKNKI